jgi:hypothetical protein
MKYSSRITVACALALIPFAVAVAAPGNVTGIEGELKDGKVHVSWIKPAGDEPVSYRVYYSRASILQENGLYDDFETVPATATEYTFPMLPYTTEALYVSVLAVNADGEESPLFLEETRIPIGNAPAQTASSQASSAASPAPVQQPSGAGVIRLLSAKAVSATGVTLAFTNDVQIDLSKAASAFTVKDASGATLRVTRLVILGKEVTLHTVRQERGRVYRLEANPAIVKGKDAQGAAIALDPQQGTILFSGHPSGAPFGSTTNSVIPPAQPMGPSLPSSAHEDVRGLTLRGQATGGTYEVNATWQAPAASDIREYRVAQSRDHGKTFAQAYSLPASTNAVKIKNVTPGAFGLSVQVVYLDNQASRGVFSEITLGKASVTQPPLPATNGQLGSIVDPADGKGKGTSLPSSGIALAIPAMLSGMGVGFQIWKRKNRAAEEGTMEA